MTVCLVLMALVMLMLARNHMAYSVSVAFINDSTLWPTEFKRLPSYEAMIFTPKHWGRWTKGQWVAYLNQEKA